MPRIKSAKKRVDVTERNRLRNNSFKSSVRTAMKKVLEGVSQNATDLTDRANKAFSMIDKAVLKGILQKNTGARYKSRLALKVAAKSA